MEINVDMGERGYQHPGDLGLLPLVNRVNLALGGHAGDQQTARDFEKRSEDLGLKVSLHPSFPDRVHFGRKKMELPESSLRESLSEQREVLPEVKSLKFHGALYNQAWRDDEFAEMLMGWCLEEGIEEVLCPPGSSQERWAKTKGLRVLREGFVDRGYMSSPDGEVLLMPRSKEDSMLTHGESLEQLREGVLSGRVKERCGQKEVWLDQRCDTWCLHSDQANSLELARDCQQWLAQN